jgi:RNA polymerase-binding protein DksA
MTRGGVRKPEKIEELRRLLLQQRRALFDEVSSLETNLQQISEDREPELEEAAQGERTARLLDRLDARGQAELAQIDHALAQIEAGEYGRCVSCREPIALGRLQALPATPYCRDCAEAIEHRGGTTEHETAVPARPAPVPGDYSLLSGRELEDAIRDHLRDDGRVDMEELRIVCRHGVVHLTGSIPSEREHHIVLQTITDVMGLKEIDDRLQVKEILWEREDRDKEESAQETGPWEDQVGTEDVTETHEDGVEFVPPTRPVPEEE